MTSKSDRRDEGRDEPDSVSFASPYASIIDRVTDADDLLHSAQVAMTRALADAGRAALERMATTGARPRGMGSDMEMRSIAAEVAGVRRSHDRRAQSEIDHALTIVDDYPAVFAAWECQRITRDHVDVVVRMGCDLDPDIRAGYEQAAIAICARDIASRVREPLRNLAARMGADSFTERHRAAAAKRGVWVTHGNDGMSELAATVPTVIAAGIHDRLTAMAQSVKEARVGAAHAADAPDAADAVHAAGGADAPAPDIRTMD